MSLPQIKRNTPIATTTISANTESFTKMSIASKNHSHDRASVVEESIPFPLGGIITVFNSSELSAKVLEIVDKKTKHVKYMYLII